MVPKVVQVSNPGSRGEKKHRPDLQLLASNGSWFPPLVTHQETICAVGAAGCTDYIARILDSNLIFEHSGTKRVTNYVDL